MGWGLEGCREGQACWQPPDQLEPTFMKVEHLGEAASGGPIVFPARGNYICSGEAVHICT